MNEVLASLQRSGHVPGGDLPAYQIDMPKSALHGDYSTNVAMLLAKPCGKPPRAVAEMIVVRLADTATFERVEIGGPGFINFAFERAAVFDAIAAALDQERAYGRSELGAGRKIQLEFVSANPTGPLHIGHGRGAAIGSALGNLLDACGFAVSCEYYVNDAGRQMDILALSVWLRYLAAQGVVCPFPAAAYQGGYVLEIAASVREQRGHAFMAALEDLDFDGLPEDPERALDALIASCRRVLGEAKYVDLLEYAKGMILDEIRTDLAAFGTEFDVWYSERGLAQAGHIDAALATLSALGHVYQEGGAQWFRSTAFGDEKDRVVVRENGMTTYFASDIAYHRDKFSRGFEQLIDVWGADHHGYVARVRAALAALELDPERLEILLVQFASLFRGGEKVAMSTRSGEFVTLKELVSEVGVDAARFFYVMRRADQHLDFDLDLAKAQSNDNPVYYVQYAHARICSVMRQFGQARLGRLAPGALAETLTETPERDLALLVARYPDTVESAGRAREPHQLTNFLRDLATAFHAYYNAHRILVEDAQLRHARLHLVLALRQVLANGLELLGVSAPNEM